jgi:hypothetical protein
MSISWAVTSSYREQTARDFLGNKHTDTRDLWPIPAGNTETKQTFFIPSYCTSHRLESHIHFPLQQADPTRSPPPEGARPCLLTSPRVCKALPVNHGLHYCRNLLLEHEHERRAKDSPRQFGPNALIQSRQAISLIDLHQQRLNRQGRLLGRRLGR